MTPDPGVKPSPLRTLPRFTPHFALIPYLHAVRVKPGARVTLEAALWCAGKRNDVDAFGLPGEAMFFRHVGGIAEMTGRSVVMQRKDLLELREASLMRWRRVNAGELLPNGQRARLGPCCVYYVAVARIEQLARPGRAAVQATEAPPPPAPEQPAERWHSDPGRSLRSDPSGFASARNHEAESGPPKSVDPVNSWLILTKITEEHRPPTPEDSGGDGVETGVEEVIRLWWEHKGAMHLGGQTPRGQTVEAVRRAVQGALVAGSTVEDCRDAILAASDERIGGEAYRFVNGENRHRRVVWGAGLFGGCLDELVAHARRYRQRMARAQATLPQDAVSRGGGRSRVIDAETARQNAAQAAAILASLQRPGGDEGPPPDESAAC